jgi:hypothetical protein
MIENDVSVVRTKRTRRQSLYSIHNYTINSFHLAETDRVEVAAVYARSLRATCLAGPLTIAQRVGDIPRRRRKHPPGMLKSSDTKTLYGEWLGLGWRRRAR